VTLADLLQRYREDILRLAAKHGASDVRIFGSVGRGEAGGGSDIDFVVRMEPGRSLFDLGALLWNPAGASSTSAPC
jgi:predicted nucleotidyltransferase